MKSLTLYTVKNDEDKFIYPTMGGGNIWGDVPDFRNAARHKDQAHGWCYNVSQTYDRPVEVAEIKITW